MSADTLLTLRVGGQIYNGWKSVSVRTAMDQIAGSFDLAITERWPGRPVDWAIPPGEACEISIGDDVVITGYVDAVDVDYDQASHSLRVTGRDRTGDLVDCSAPSDSLSGLTFTDIANRVCAPFNIAVRSTLPAGKKITKASVQNGESVFRVLERLARAEGALLVSDGVGGLLITRAGTGGDSTTVLDFGRNILRASGNKNHTGLFSKITVKGQGSAAEAAQFDLAQASPSGSVERGTTASVRGSQVARYRPLIIVAESNADATRCQQRAEWEAGNREARAHTVNITVQGWRQDDGSVWRINQRVRVRCPWLRVDGWLLVAAVEYQLSDSGSLAVLSLVPDTAFDVLPEIPDPADNTYKVVGA
jgi:prophage tail gpP-like protein